MPRALNAHEPAPDVMFYRVPPPRLKAEDPMVKLEVVTHRGTQATLQCRLSEVPRVCGDYNMALPDWYATEVAAFEKQLHAKVEDKAVGGPR